MVPANCAGARRVKMLSGHLKLEMTILELKFWPFGLEQAGASWERLVEMLRGLSMDLMRDDEGCNPFDARDHMRSLPQATRLGF